MMLKPTHLALILAGILVSTLSLGWAYFGNHQPQVEPKAKPIFEDTLTDTQSGTNVDTPLSQTGSEPKEPTNTGTLDTSSGSIQIPNTSTGISEPKPDTKPSTPSKEVDRPPTQEQKVIEEKEVKKTMDEIDKLFDGIAGESSNPTKSPSK